MDSSAYRIIDANFNRAREAARLIEEFCRFTLNNESLTGEIKQLRHELTSAINKLDTARLLTSRDTVGDVGVGRKVENQLVRRDLNDCFLAGCKRLTEALRVLAELTQPINPEIADTLEQLRYRAYTLEKNIFMAADVSAKFSKVQLYIIITSDLPVEIINLTQKCIAGGADCIQLRAKAVVDDNLFAISCEFVNMCKAGGVISIINDRVDIAVAAGADGVHLGCDDLSIETARKLQRQPMIIGKTTHNLAQLRRACQSGATYVSLGPVFATPTKPNLEPVGLKYIKKGLAELEGTSVGHVTIGGITLDNAEDVLEAGAKTLAVCSAITDSCDPVDMCRKFKGKIVNFSK